MECHGFHVNASRLNFGEVTNLATVLSQHVALSAAYVPEITLCVTFGAPCSGTTFRVLTRCSKYITISFTSGALVSETIMFSLTSGALVSETILRVTFGARCRSPPMGLLECLRAILAAKVAHGIRNGCCWPPVGPPTLPNEAGQAAANSFLGCQLRRAAFSIHIFYCD